MAPLGRARPLAVLAPLAMDAGMWLNLVDICPHIWKWIA